MDSAPLLREKLKVYPYREPLRCVSAHSHLAPVTKQLWTLSIVYGSYKPQTTWLIHVWFQTKISSAFVDGSPESSENSAFDRALTEGASYFCSQMRVEILSEPWNPWNARILAIPKMLPEPQKYLFLKNGILHPKPSAIDRVEYLLYRAFRWPSKNRRFWPPGPKNHDSQPLSELFELNRIIWSLAQVWNELKHIGEVLYMYRLSVSTIKTVRFSCPA